MDCKTARYLLDFARPQGNDLDAADRAALNAHLAICSECDSLARAERQLDEHIGKAIRDVPVPAGLKDRLLTRLRRQRDEWWMEGLKRTARYAAVAAALVLIVWGVFLYKINNPPTLSADKLENELLGTFVLSPPSHDDAQKALKVSLPTEFDYRYLAEYGFATLQEREVPYLRFIRWTPQNTVAQYAVVYLLTDKKFNLSDLPSLHRDAGGYRVKVEIRKPRENYAYAIVYTGNLEDLMDSTGDL